MIIEMRTYKTKPGLRTRFLEIFRGKSVPAHAEIGMRYSDRFFRWKIPMSSFLCADFRIWLRAVR